MSETIERSLVQAEANRVAGHEAALAELMATADLLADATTKQIDAAIELVAARLAGRDWQIDFRGRARDVAEVATARFNNSFAAALKREEEAAELIRLREETAERQRVDYYTGMIAHIKGCGLGFIGPDPQPIGLCLYELKKKIKIDSEWREFEAPAIEARDAAIAHIEKVSAELEKKLAEERKAENAKIAAEAAQRARDEAEARAAQERAQAAERERKAEDARLAAVAAQENAERRAEQQKQDAARREQEAAAKALRDQEAAVEAERRKVAAAAEAQRKKDERRAADKAHRQHVNREAVKALVSAGVAEETAIIVITAIARGQVPRVTIGY